MQNAYPEDLTKLDLLLALLERTAKSEKHTSVHALSVRIPTFDYANIEAMAQHSGLSRNKIICQLLEFALSEVWKGLDEENGQAINKIRFQIYNDLVAGQLRGDSTLPQAEPGEV
jgi:hypothetical protein